MAVLDRRIEALVKTLGDERARPDVRWVEELADATAAQVRRVLLDLVRHETELEAIRAEHRGGGREFYAQISAPFELYALARLLRPAHVVEAGVSSGVSSALFLLGLQDNGSGTLHSIDLPVQQREVTLRKGESIVSVPPKRSSGWAVPEKLRSGWDLRIGPSQELLPPLIEELPSVGLFLHDDLHTPTHLTFELTTIRARLHPGSVVLADNTQWTGKAFDRFARALGVPVLHRAGTDLVGLRVPESSPRVGHPA
ncbi:MAG: class I SAM-dependent methyltransferase [Thermoplasmata archaeon]|nr:class I SAM-dependent methyltransferase [Thermoplasmata archaeon]